MPNVIQFVRILWGKDVTKVSMSKHGSCAHACKNTEINFIKREHPFYCDQ
jgi:hypothetical protein